jgi:hypothetical protein
MSVSGPAEMSAQQPFNPRLVAGMIAAGIITFAALMLLIAYGGGIGGRSDGRAHALSTSAVGFKGLVDLVGRFRDVHLVEDANDLSFDHLAVIALEPQSDADALSAILQRRADLPTLIILPKWSTIPHPSRPGWVQGVYDGLGNTVSQMIGEQVAVRPIENAPLADEAAGIGILEGLRFRIPPSPQAIQGPGLTALVPLDAPRTAGSESGGKAAVGKSDGPALVAQIGESPHYVVADPDLLNNRGLHDRRAARDALALIVSLNDLEPGVVDFDLTMNGLGAANSMSMLRLAFEPPFLAMTLALVVAALLAGLHGAFRFGPVRRPQRTIAFGKAALVENSAGLIRMAERETRLGGAYADVVRHDLSRAVHAPPSLDAGDLDQRLDRLTPKGEQSFSELAANLAVARDRSRLVAAAQALFRWKKAVVP